MSDDTPEALHRAIGTLRIAAIGAHDALAQRDVALAEALLETALAQTDPPCVHGASRAVECAACDAAIARIVHEGRAQGLVEDADADDPADVACAVPGCDMDMDAPPAVEVLITTEDDEDLLFCGAHAEAILAFARTLRVPRKNGAS
jgi:hypothetical protein